MNYSQKKEKAARRIENRTPLDDAYDLVCRAELDAREHLADELDGLLSEDWIDDAALMIACAAADEQSSKRAKGYHSSCLFIDPRSYSEMHREIGLSVLEGVLDEELYSETIIPCDEALRIASAVIQDGLYS